VWRSPRGRRASCQGSAEACVTAQAGAVRDEQARTGDRNENNRNLVVWKTFIYRCLPDTVDPRGPKGQ